MKFTLSLVLACFASVPAAAGGGSFISAGGGAASSSTGTHTDGASASFKNVTVETLNSTGTAPSLTATGAVFTGSGTFTGTNGLSVGGNLGVGTAAPGAKLDVSRTDGVQIIARGSGNASSSDVQGHIQVGGTASGSMRLEYGGLGVSEGYISNSYDNGSANDAGLSFRIRTAGTAITAMRAASNGGVSFYSRSIVQLMAIAPDAVGTQFYCNNCSPTKMVVSTGTAAGNFAAIDGGAFQ